MSADPDLIAVEDDQGVPPVAIRDHGSMEAASSERVTATKTAFNDFDTLQDQVAEVAGGLGWDRFVEKDESDADDDEEEEEDGNERVRSFQLYEME
jgi:hypothetical protein